MYAYGQGMADRPAIIGGVGAASPAYDAGLRAGDEIVAVDGKQDISYTGMTLKVRLSGQGQTLHFDVKRPGQDGLIGMDIQPRREPGVDYPTIGVLPHEQPGRGTPRGPRRNARSSQDSPAIRQPQTTRASRPWWRLALPGAEPIPMRDIQDYNNLLAKYQNKPLVHVFEHKEKPEAPASKRYEITIPPANFVDFGFRLTMEPVNGIQKGSPADKAGFRTGDRIVKVNGKDDFDPMRLPSALLRECRQAHDLRGPARRVRRSEDRDADRHAGRYSSLDRAGAAPGAARGLRPRALLSHSSPYPGRAAGVTGGKSGSETRRRDHRDRISHSPEARGFQVRRTGEGAEQRHGEGRTKEEEETIKLDDKSPSWVSVFRALQFRPSGPISLVVNNGSSPVRVTPEPDPTWFLPDRGLRFLDLVRKLPPQSIGAALRRGVDDTVENILSIYAMIRGLAQHRVGPKSVAGPVKIVQIAYAAASYGLNELIHFLGILSINLAVINFLPIPPLDGGQMVFLLAEKVRGKPLPESALMPAIYLGILMILCLFVFVMYQDVFGLIRDWRGVRP